MPMARKLIGAALTGDPHLYKKTLRDILYYLKRDYGAYLAHRKMRLRLMALT